MERSRCVRGPVDLPSTLGQRGGIAHVAFTFSRSGLIGSCHLLPSFKCSRRVDRLVDKKESSVGG